MDNTTKLNTQFSKIAGISLIAMAVIAGFGYGYAFESLYVANDKTTTLANLDKSGWLFMWVIVSFIVIGILDVIVAWALYLLFKSVSGSLSLITAWLRLVYSAILGASIFYLFSVLHLLDNAPKDANVIMNDLNSFLKVWSLGLIVFGSHIFLLGVILKRSGIVPKAISYLTLFAGVCYMLTNIANLLIPSYELYRGTVDMFLALPMALGELVLAVWLIRFSQKTSRFSILKRLRVKTAN